MEARREMVIFFLTQLLVLRGTSGIYGPEGEDPYVNAARKGG